MASLFIVLLAWSAFTFAAEQLSTTKQLIAAADQEPEAFHIPLPPSLDLWYRAPDGFNWWNYPPGTVLKIRRAPLLNYTVGNAMAAYQILYRSTDSQYNAAWDVTTLFIPWWQYRCSATTAHLCQFAVHYSTYSTSLISSYGAWD